MDHQKRYHRQEILKGFGPSAQQALSTAKVLVIGAGGLGCPVLQYLCSCGVGTIGIADDDFISLSNLHRQVLYTEEDLSRSKAEVAAEKLQQMNGSLQLRVCKERVEQLQMLSMIPEYDVVVDCTDNFPTRYMINDACLILNKPLVWGAVSEFEGQVAVFNWQGSGNYRDLFPDMPAAGEVADCAEAGVLGVLPGIIGSLQAVEVIKLITGIGKPLTNQILTYQLLSNELSKLYYQPAPREADKVTAEKQFRESSYEQPCVAATTGTQLDWPDFMQLMDEENVTLVDVRDPHEVPEITRFKHLRAPIYELDDKFEAFSGKILFVCKTGTRSMQACLMAAEKGLQAYSLKGGLAGLKDGF